MYYTPVIKEKLPFKGSNINIITHYYINVNYITIT